MFGILTNNGTEPIFGSSFDPNPTVRHTFWGLLIGGMFNWFGTYGASQASLQRFSSLTSTQEAKKAVLLNCVGVFVLLTLVCLSGISVFAFYADRGCDPLSNGDIKNSNQIIPYFVSKMLGYPGVTGLFIACLFCGALSTLSSNLSSMVAVTWEDMMAPFFKDKPENVKAWITRFLVIFYGILGIGATFLFKNLKGTVLQASLSFMGAASGALNGLIMLGAFFPWANRKGAIAGTVTSYAVTMWIGIGKYTVVGVDENLPFPNNSCRGGGIDNTTSYTVLPFAFQDTVSTYPSVVNTKFQNVTGNLAYESMSGLEQFYNLSYLWYSAFGLLIAFVVGLIVSLLTGPTDPKDVDPKYIIPIFDRLFWCCLPKKILNCLHCDVEYDTMEINTDDARIDPNPYTLRSPTDLSNIEFKSNIQDDLSSYHLGV